MFLPSNNIYPLLVPEALLEGRSFGCCEHVQRCNRYSVLKCQFAKSVTPLGLNERHIARLNSEQIGNCTVYVGEEELACVRSSLSMHGNF